LRPKNATISFGKLKEYCESLPTWKESQLQRPMKISVQWREEQFVQAVHKRNTTKVAREALHWQACQQQGDRGVAAPV